MPSLKNLSAKGKLLEQVNDIVKRYREKDLDFIGCINELIKAGKYRGSMSGMQSKVFFTPIVQEMFFSDLRLGIPLKTVMSLFRIRERSMQSCLK